MKPRNEVEYHSATNLGNDSDDRRNFIAPLQILSRKIDVILDSVSKKFKFLGQWKVSLAITIATVLIVIGARYYYSFVTGFIVPDEAWYYNTYILDRTPITSYRTVFVAVFILFFQGANDVWTFLLLGALYSAIWSVGCIVLFFIILRRLKVTEIISSLLVLSLPLFPVFLVFVPTILTEPLGLFLALLGVYFGLRYMQQGRIVNGLLSLVFFVLAYKVREPYLLFALGNILFFLGLSLKRRAMWDILTYATLLSIILPIPVRLAPLQLGQPVYGGIMTAIAQMISWVSHTRPPVLGPSSTSGFRVPIRMEWPPDLPSALAIGLAYGFNPLFAFFAAFSMFAVALDLRRNRSSIDLFLALNSLWSLGSFAVTTTILLQVLQGALTGWTSSIIRTTHGSLPLIFAFPSLYRRLKPKRVAALTLIVLILLSTQVGSFADAFQRSLSREPVDRLSLDYRAPYYRMYLVAKDSGKTLVIGGLHMRGIRMYMHMLPNVLLVGTIESGGYFSLSENEFQILLKQPWDSIYLYDDWVTIAIPSDINAYPQFYSNILRSRQYPGYSIEPLWIDGESYALKMTPTAAVSQVQSASCQTCRSSIARNSGEFRDVISMTSPTASVGMWNDTICRACAVPNMWVGCWDA